MIFFFPLIFGSVAVLFFCFGSSAGFKWKVVAGALLALSILLQFFYADAVPHLVPLFIQIVVCMWMIVYWKMP
jgi:hypothetical protein